MSTADSINPPDTSAQKPAALIHHGDHDSNVLKLQQQLHRLGYPVAADGVFGPQTEAALRDAQAHAGVTPNGIAGPQSTLALGNLEARGYHAEPAAHHAPEHHAPEHYAPEHHAHHAPEHHAPDADFGTLPFPGGHHDDHAVAAHEADAAPVEDDPYKPEEHHDLHGHEDPYKPEDEHASSLHDYAAEDPYAAPHEPDAPIEHDAPKDDDDSY